ncbi:hypothetical protein DPMN_017737 [Dreissena polymorpha]|uniref:Uncharacterized protein n=1 Tax=Dreissena polymorpha TaxID=45954 RepID=A0A9D4NH34_DREPO|nr:hypothetical protein DPMN_017737 [Dreissena polymorpha]
MSSGLCMETYVSELCMETYDLETMYGNLCLRVYAWRPMSSGRCMETDVSEHFVMEPCSIV